MDLSTGTSLTCLKYDDIRLSWHKGRILSFLAEAHQLSQHRNSELRLANGQLNRTQSKDGEFSWNWTTIPRFTACDTRIIFIRNQNHSLSFRVLEKECRPARPLLHFLMLYFKFIETLRPIFQSPIIRNTERYRGNTVIPIHVAPSIR
ncbi:hypothetical protein D3C73_992390 [compost metagenome]